MTDIQRKFPVLKFDDGVLNAFQPVEGGFRFIGGKEEARRWIQCNIALLEEMKKRRPINEILTRLFCSVINIEMIEELYIAYRKIRAELGMR